MKIKGMNHIAINASDIKASTDFYGGVLGFTQKETVAFEGFSVVYFEVPGGSLLELFDYGGKNRGNASGETDAGLRHLAFAVDNVDEAEKYLRTRGIKITMTATDLPSLNSRAILFLDPNGVTLELCQRMK